MNKPILIMWPAISCGGKRFSIEIKEGGATEVKCSSWENRIENFSAKGLCMTFKVARAIADGLTRYLNEAFPSLSENS